MSETSGSPVDFSNGRLIKDSPVDRLPTAVDAAAAPKRQALDSEAMNRLHKKLLGYHLREIRRQSDNRVEMELDEEFYDNVQWNSEDAALLRKRNQTPIVYNVIAPTINWIMGTEKRSKTDYKILPRRKDGSKQAERKSQLMKYLSDVNRSQFSKSSAFEDAVKVGVGWIEAGLQSDDDGEPVYDRHECWRYILWDSSSTEKDMKDCRYMTRAKWIDLDVAYAMFGDRKSLLRESATENDGALHDPIHGDSAMDSIEIEMTDAAGPTHDSSDSYTRERVRIIEVWYRAPIEVDIMRGGEFNGMAFEEHNLAHRESLESGQSVIASRVMMRMHIAVMTMKGLLFVSKSPYRHNDFPFTPIWCNRRGKNGMPYGVIRGLRDIQADVNKRASKATHILSSSKVIMDEGAVENLDEFADEVARPDAIIVKKANASLMIDQDRDLAPAHLELMSRNIAMIQQASGVTDENMGRSTNARSGIAIQARQSQGSLATAGLFENLRFGSQLHGEKVLSLIEQFFTEEKAFRITNMRGTPEYVTVNDGLPENDIIRTKADFIISEDDWRMSIRQAQTAELLELLGQLAPVAPQIVLIMLDILVENMDIPNREELVARIRQATGQRDPDAEEPTPQEIQRQQAQAEQAAMQKAMVEADIAGKQAKAQLTMAQAARQKADAEKVLAAIATQNVASQKAALETAIMMLGSIPAVPVADGVLHEAGFISRTDQEDDLFMAEALASNRAELDQRYVAQMQSQQAEQQPADQQPKMPQQ